MNSNLNVAVAPKATEEFCVLIADENLLVAEALVSSLGQFAKWRVIGVDDLEDVHRILAERHVDLILYGVGLRNCRGLESIAGLIQRATDSAVVLFTNAVDYDLIEAALKLGAHGVVRKNISLQSLMRTIDLLESGERYVPADVFTAFNNRPATASTLPGRLTPKEIEILKLIDSGLSNKAIGHEIGSNENYVKMFLRRLYPKMGARNRVHAVKLGKSLGVL